MPENGSQRRGDDKEIQARKRDEKMARGKMDEERSTVDGKNCGKEHETRNREEEKKKRQRTEKEVAFWRCGASNPIRAAFLGIKAVYHAQEETGQPVAASSVDLQCVGFTMDFRFVYDVIVLFRLIGLD